MKNIHILPTDKPSRFLYNSTLKSFCIQKEIDGMFINDGKVSGADFWGLEKALNNGFNPYNIYITSDEEIKEGDWYYYFGHIINYEYDEHTLTPNCKKIILTTDGDLIKDGVQSIGDEFLEWFVNNPNCEEVEVVKGFADSTSYGFNFLDYKIIIPKEEPKQLTDLEIAIKLEEIEREEPKPNTCDIIFERAALIDIEESKQERMYSEEEVLNILYKHTEDLLAGKKMTLEQWFEQFKKK